MVAPGFFESIGRTGKGRRQAAFFCLRYYFAVSDLVSVLALLTFFEAVFLGAILSPLLVGSPLCTAPVVLLALSWASAGARAVDGDKGQSSGGEDQFTHWMDLLFLKRFLPARFNGGRVR